jgi:hypothetical protein
MSGWEDDSRLGWGRSGAGLIKFKCKYQFQECVEILMCTLKYKRTKMQINLTCGSGKKYKKRCI